MHPSAQSMLQHHSIVRDMSWRVHVFTAASKAVNKAVSLSTEISCRPCVDSSSLRQVEGAFEYALNALNEP